MNEPALAEGWYLMSNAELEAELARWRSGEGPRSGAIPLDTDRALAYKHAGNVPDENGRWLRLVLHVDDEGDLRALSEKRARYEPDYHSAPTWRRPGSKPVNVVPLRARDVRVDHAPPWWEEPGIAELEDEWARRGTVAGMPVPGEYRGFVFKTVIALRGAGQEVTPKAVADSVERWLSPEDAAGLRRALGVEARGSSPT